MSKENFVRPAVVAPAPKVPHPEIIIPAPKEVEAAPGKQWQTVLLPVVMVVGIGGMMVMMFRNGSASSFMSNPMMMFFPLMILVSMFGMMGRNTGNTKQDVEGDRKERAQAMERLRGQILDSGKAQRVALTYSFPDPVVAQSRIGTERMWEVQPTHDLFGNARYGLGRIAPSAVILPTDAAPLQYLDPVSSVLTASLQKHHEAVTDMPITVSLTAYPSIALAGDRRRMMAMLRAMLTNVTIAHGPDNMKIVLLADDPDAQEWAWLKWLPHTAHPTEVDALGAGRMMYANWQTLLESLAGNETDEKAPRVVTFNREWNSNDRPNDDSAHHTVIVVDSLKHPERMLDRAVEPVAGVTWLLVQPPEGSLAERDGITLSVAADGVVSLDEASKPLEAPVAIARADDLSESAARIAALMLSEWEIGEFTRASATKKASKSRDWSSLVGISDPGAIDPEKTWRHMRYKDKKRMRVTIGWDEKGNKVYLDLKPTADGGEGPHGILVGTTGSGKSEFLRNMVLNLAVTHSPDQLNLLLTDYKGGATFLDMQDSPHVIAVITNMEEEKHLVERLEESIRGEMDRRQRILREAGNLVNFEQYEALRERRDLPPVPAWFWVIDEFNALLADFPEFGKLFVLLGQQGRSLNMSMLLASQEIETGRVTGLEANVQFKIALRTMTSQHSRAVIDSGEAKNLPADPGHGLMKTPRRDQQLQRFLSGYTGSKYFPPEDIVEGSVVENDVDTTAAERAAQEAAEEAIQPKKFTAAAVPLPDDAALVVAEAEQERVRTQEEEDAAPTVFNVVVDRLHGHGRPEHKQWLPDLERITLDQCTTQWSEGWAPVPDGQPPRLRIPFGKHDNPRKHTQPDWELDLSGSDGNLLVLGGVGAGRSTALKTFVLSTALTHTPEQVQMFLVDYTVGGLNQLAELPHVSGVASRADTDAIDRIFSQVKGLIRRREKLFREHKISGGIGEYRARRANPNDELRSLDPYGDVFVVFDGWEAAVAEGNQLNDRQAELKGIFSGALNVGVHLVVAATNMISLRSLGELFNSKVELKTVDDADSAINRQMARKVPSKKPGRGLSTDAPTLHSLVALPRIDGVADPGTVSTALVEMSLRVAQAYGDRRAPRLMTLPDSVTVEDLRRIHPAPAADAPVRERLRLAFGVRETTLGPAVVDMSRTPHLLILGEPRMGKSELVAGLVRQIEDRFPTRDDAVIFLIDPQQRHLDLQRSKNMYAVSNGRADDVKEKFTALAQELNIGAREVPADLASQEERAARGWWSGPEIFIVIDDYQVASPRQPIEPPAVHEFATVIGQAYERGYHLIVARSFADVGRAQHADPVIRELLQTQMPTVLLGGNWREEGEIAGVRAKSFGIEGRADFTEPIRSRVDRVQAVWSGVRLDDMEVEDEGY